MINYNKNKLINQALGKYYETFSRTLDTADYVPEKFNKKIHKYIYKNMKKAFRKIDREDRKFQKNFNRSLKLKEKEEKTKKNVDESANKPNKLVLFFRKLFSRKKNVVLSDDNSPATNKT